MPTRLSVNLNKIALLRNARGRDYPQVKEFAHLALDNGALGITLHPRPDQRHARYDDVYDMKRLLEQYPDAELNIEGKPSEKFLEVVLDAKPEQCTLVPDADNQITSDHGWQLDESLNSELKDTVDTLRSAGIRVSLFMDPDLEQVRQVSKYGADSVELYTEDFAVLYAHAQKLQSNQALDACMTMYKQCTDYAKNTGLIVNAGHDLNLDNLGLFLTSMKYIDEVSIGHALTVESLHFGFANTVKNYINIINESA